jgi:hypothetical protein
VKVTFLGTLAFALLCTSAPVFAHHGFAAEFNRSSPITLNGIVTKVEFMNPHIYFYLDIKDKDGKVVNWAFEGGPPNVLYRHGWRKDTIKPGDVLTVKGFRARDGSYLAACTSITLPDGREIPAISGGGEPTTSGDAYGGGANKN